MVSSIPSVQSVTGGFWMQIQQQLAQRNVEQAEQQATTLRAKVQGAQAIAERARENARSLQIEANQAQGEASQARGFGCQQGAWRSSGTIERPA